MAAHRPQVQTDELFCPLCNKRWGRDEDAPECVEQPTEPVPTKKIGPRVKSERREPFFTPRRPPAPRYGHR